MTIIIHANIPEELVERWQWLLWRYIQRQGMGEAHEDAFYLHGLLPPPP